MLEAVVAKITQVVSDNDRLRDYMKNIAEMLDEMDKGEANYSLGQLAYELRTAADLHHEFD